MTCSRLLDYHSGNNINSTFWNLGLIWTKQIRHCFRFFCKMRNLGISALTKCLRKWQENQASCVRINISNLCSVLKQIHRNIISITGNTLFNTHVLRITVCLSPAQTSQGNGIFSRTSSLQNMLIKYLFKISNGRTSPAVYRPCRAQIPHLGLVPLAVWKLKEWAGNILGKPKLSDIGVCLTAILARTSSYRFNLCDGAIKRYIHGLTLRKWGCQAWT